MPNAAVSDYQLWSVDPALPVGRMNIAVHADPVGNPVRNYYLNARNHGGVDARTTATETIGLASQGKIVTLNNVGTTAVTLDSTVPNYFMTYVSAEGAGGATLTPSTGLIDNVANLSLFQLQGVALFFDGTNWWTERGMGGGGSTGVLLETGNYTTSTADNGKLISFDLSANATLTLPSVAPPNTWSIEVENTQPGGLLFVNPNGLMLDESTAEVPIPSPHGMRIFSNGSNYYTERGMPDVSQQPCSITVDGTEEFAFAAYALIASFETTTPAPNFGFRQAVGTSVMQAIGGVYINMNCLAGSTIVVIGQIVSVGITNYGVQDSQGNAYNIFLHSTYGGSYAYLMAYAVNVAAGPNTIEIIQSVFPITSPMGNLATAVIGASAGTGFSVNDVLGITGGGGSGAMVQVSSIGGGGAITGLNIVSSGQGYTNTTGAATTVLSGSGSGSPTVNITIAGFPYGGSPLVLKHLPVSSVTGYVFAKGGLATQNTGPPNEYFVSGANGNNSDLGAAPWIAWPAIGIIAMEYQGAGSGVTLLGSSAGTNPGLPCPSGSVPCPPAGLGWAVGAGMNMNRGDPTNFPEVWSASPGWQKRITVSQPAIYPNFGGGGGFSMAAFDGFGCCSPGFYQGVSNNGGGALTQQPTLSFIPPLVAVNDPIASATDVFLEAGGVDARTTTTETIGATDYTKLVTLSNSGAIAVTLSSTVFTYFYCAVEDIGAGTATLTPSSGTINGVASISLTTGQSCWVFFDGTNWWALLGGSSITTPVSVPNGGTGATTLTAHAVLLGEGTSAIATTGPGTAGQVLTSNGAADPSFKALPLFVVSAVPGKPTAGQLVCIYTAATHTTFPGNFATPNSVGSVGTNPTATATYTVYKNGSSTGTIAISTGGVFTFATTGGSAISLAIGDRLTIVAPGTQDTTLADVGITLYGTQS